MARNLTYKNSTPAQKKGSYSHESSPLYTHKAKKDSNNCFQPPELESYLKLSSRNGLKKPSTKPTAANMFIGNLSMRINSSQANQKKTPEPLSSSITNRKNSKHYFGLTSQEEAMLTANRNLKSKQKDRTPQTSFDETNTNLIAGSSYEVRKNPLALVSRHHSEAASNADKGNLQKLKGVSEILQKAPLRSQLQMFSQIDSANRLKKPNSRNQKSFDANANTETRNKYTPYLNPSIRPTSTANNSPRNRDTKTKLVQNNGTTSRGFSQSISSKPIKEPLEKNMTLLKGPTKSPMVVAKHRKAPSYDLTKRSENLAHNILNAPLLDKMRKSADFGDNLHDNELQGNNMKAPRFAIRTRAGVAPNGTRKVNQDSFIFHSNYGKKSDRYLLGVCDGHGMNGHLVSGFVKETLPAFLLADPSLKSDVGLAFTNAFEFCLQKLLMCDFDCKFSGTTAAFLLMDGNKIISANAGDSRAIMAGYDKGWNYIPLTRDHKPNDPVESQRIVKAGGRIEAFKDMDGNFVGPSRVWLLNQDIPGLAMSRSIGDLVAASVGVSYIPEIKEFEITPNDRFIVIASDGVWEFIENIDVVKVVATFYEKNDIEGACDYLLALALKRWQEEEEVVVDDITLMIAFF